MLEYYTSDGYYNYHDFVMIITTTMTIAMI